MDLGKIVRELDVEPVEWPVPQPKEQPAIPERVEEPAEAK